MCLSAGECAEQPTAGLDSWPVLLALSPTIAANDGSSCGAGTMSSHSHGQAQHDLTQGTTYIWHTLAAKPGCT